MNTYDNLRYHNKELFTREIELRRSIIGVNNNYVRRALTLISRYMGFIYMLT